MFLLRLFWTLVVVGRDLVNDFLDKNCLHLAAGIAFYALFSLFPLVLVLLSALGFLSDSTAVAPQLVREIGALLPISNDLGSNTLDGLIRAPAVTGIFGALGLLWASTAVFSAIRKGINAAWGIHQPRPFLHERLIEFSLLAGAVVLLLIPMAIAVVAPVAASGIRWVFPDADVSGESLRRLGGSLLGPLLAFMIFVTLYRYLPNARVPFRAVGLGALLATVAVAVAKGVFSWYVETFPYYQGIYGPIGWVVALLGFVYISAVVLLFGALVTSRLAAWFSARDEENLSGAAEVRTEGR